MLELLARHPFFEPWTDPISGVRSYILTERVAPVQQSFYYTNSSLSADEKWLWIRVAFPPAPGKMLAVVSMDPRQPFIRHFPHAVFDAEAMVAEEGDGCYLCMRESVWRLGIDGSIKPIVTLGSDYIQNRRLYRLATHLTKSADGRWFLLDGEIGNHWFVGLGDAETGAVRIIKEFIHHHNHAQFSPVHPNLMTIAMDHFHDKITGRRYHYDHRVWLLDTADTRFECLTPDVYCKHLTGVCHEWWSKDGRVCYVDYERGVYELDLETRQHTHVWKEPLCHAHCDPTRRYWCADESPYKWTKTPCKVKFFDRQTNKVTDIASALPQPTVQRSWYHIDPHPQFSPKGTSVVYTTTVRGSVDVAITPIEQML